MDFIKINKKDYCVNICWAAIADYCKAKKVYDLNKIGNIAENMSSEDLLLMFFLGLKYGAKLQKTELDIADTEELGLYVSSPEVLEFTKIFAKQLNSNNPEVKAENSNEEIKKKKSFWKRLRG